MTAIDQSTTPVADGVTLTEGAASKVKALLDGEGRDDLALRIAVQPGGCSGLRYQLFFDERSLDGDIVKEYGGVNVVTDRMSAPYLMGATIDYGILYTSYYREMRRLMGVREALAAAYRGSIHTVLTSGSIMVLITALVGPLFKNPTIEAIVQTLSIGCLSAILLILLILPGLLALFDRWVVHKN